MSQETVNSIEEISSSPLEEITNEQVEELLKKLMDDCKCCEDESSSQDDFTEEEYLFHLNLLYKVDEIPINPKKYKNGTRKSLTFTNDKMREIERENQILLQKILKQGSNCGDTLRRSSSSSSTSLNRISSASRIASATINRKNKQRQIDLDNQVLDRKIKKQKARPRKI